jgi:hypothetical protein
VQSICYFLRRFVVLRCRSASPSAHDATIRMMRPMSASSRGRLAIGRYASEARGLPPVSALTTSPMTYTATAPTTFSQRNSTFVCVAT